MSEHLEMYESPEDRIRRGVREAGAGHPYASRAAVEALGEDVHRWSKQVQDRLDQWVTGTNAALVAALGTLEDRIRALEARTDQQDRDAAERRERS